MWDWIWLLMFGLSGSFVGVIAVFLFVKEAVLEIYSYSWEIKKNA